MLQRLFIDPLCPESLIPCCLRFEAGFGESCFNYFCSLPTVFITDKISSFCLQVALQILHRKMPQFCAHLCNAVIDYLSHRNSSADGRYGQGLRIAPG